MGTAECVVDAILSGWELSRTGLNIDLAARSCPESGHGEVASCTSDVASIVNVFASIASIVSFLCNECPEAINKHALCAGDIAGIVEGTADLIDGSAGLAESCN